MFFDSHFVLAKLGSIYSVVTPTGGTPGDILACNYLESLSVVTKLGSYRRFRRVSSLGTIIPSWAVNVV